MDRRRALISLGATSLLLPTLARSSHGAQDTKEKMIDYLFVHTAEGCTLRDGTLRLRGVAPTTLFFSDRPDRIVGHLPTNTFVAHWGAGGNESFEAEPPNAALTMQTSPHHEEELVVVLRNPRLDDGDLTYDVNVLGDDAVVTEGGVCSLFIDVIGMPMTPASYAGATRRVARRTARRTTRRVIRRHSW